jgi:bifunctional NMN adenylyltransferase/nudix hydrolase
MKTIEDAKTATAAIVGRFQAPRLHEAHVQLFEEILKNHHRVLVLLGIPKMLGTRRNPLDFITRKNMIEETYPQVTCLPLADIPGNDKAWSVRLDDTIHLIAPIGQITLYGGRDSFVKHYTGKHRTVELDTFAWESGTEVREEVGKTPLCTEEARKGVVYLAENQYPRVNQVVDMAILRSLTQNAGDDSPPTRAVLMGQREADREGGLNWRFPGGFVNTTDANLEAAARRELGEETGISVEHLEYICSMPIKDSRMSGGDIIMTAFFKGERAFGADRAGDDLAVVQWIPLERLRTATGIVYENHLPLLGALLATELG